MYINNFCLNTCAIKVLFIEKQGVYCKSITTYITEWQYASFWTLINLKAKVSMVILIFNDSAIVFSH
jgi:hypothetical protein